MTSKAEAELSQIFDSGFNKLSDNNVENELVTISKDQGINNI